MAAHTLSSAICDCGEHTELLPIEQLLLFLPYLSVEEEDAQRQAIVLLKQWQETYGEDSFGGLAQSLKEIAEVNLTTLSTFSRFPHRNDCLRRQTTTQEAKFLSDNIIPTD